MVRSSAEFGEFFTKSTGNLEHQFQNSMLIPTLYSDDSRIRSLRGKRNNLEDVQVGCKCEM